MTNYLTRENCRHLAFTVEVKTGRADCLDCRATFATVADLLAERAARPIAARTTEERGDGWRSPFWQDRRRSNTLR
jgi:hypothetical protein